MGARSYVPAIGRFISTDPVPGGSANSYEYATGDPVNVVDLAGATALRATGGAIVCDFRALLPHNSDHERGRINAGILLECRGGPVYGTVQAVLWRGGAVVATGVPVKYHFSGLKAVEETRAYVNIPCVAGVYRVFIEVVENYPPDYDPPMIARNKFSRKVEIAC
jgi:hypothetical protein